MSEHPECLDHMLAAWNESEPSLVRGHLERGLAPGIRFVDPSIDVIGFDGFEANIREVKSKLPGAVYSRTSGVDSHHDFHRYHWAIHQKGELVLTGFDVTQTDEADLAVCVMGFFGPVPKK